jgi:dTDP-glucose 4,6-dehydratase
VNTILVTGGAGFIGTNFVRLVLDQRRDWRVVVLDALTYAGNLENLDGLEAACGDRYRFVHGDVTDAALLERLFSEEAFGGVIHFAAESHVDRSILGPLAFVQTNVTGTGRLLEACRAAWKNREGRFLQVSTDEVYGALGDTGAFTEQTPVNPSSPYSASKAAADHLVLAYHRTFGMNALITRCCNNYGPYQFPEKLIPLMIARLIDGQTLPVYGKGENVRDWIHVEDHNRGVLLAFEKGRPGQVYNLGSRCEKRNLDLVLRLVAEVADAVGKAPEDLRRQIAFVADRPGHDWRYAIDPTRAEEELGFKPAVSFDDGLKATVRWYVENEGWWRRIMSGEYQGFVKRLYGERS